MIEAKRRNINRGYMKLRIWQDTVEYYVKTCERFSSLRDSLRRVYWQQTACVDSIHRNIAEGYCRRSVREYLQFLNFAQGSAGESVSALHAYLAAGQISQDDFDELDALAFRIENALKKLIESLERKSDEDSWDETFIVRESNAVYETHPRPSTPLQYSTIPTPQPSTEAHP